MSTPIPKDVMAAAMRALMVNQPEMVESVARALLARDERAAKKEREACAKLAETHKYYEIGDRWMLASAIRDRSKP